MTPEVTMPKGPVGNVVSNNPNPTYNKQNAHGKQSTQLQQKQRKDSGSGKRLAVDNQAAAKNAKSQPLAVTALTAFQSNSRYNKGRGGSSASEIVPTPPPLYPSAPKPSPLNPEMMDKVGVYTRFSQYFSSNYGVQLERPYKSAFHVDRFIDRYNAALTVNPDIVHRVGPGRFPEELSSASMPIKKVQKPHLAIKAVKRVLDSLPEDDEQEEEGANQKRRKVGEDDEDANPAKDPLEEEEMDEADEELDMGTDYVSNYFDNGEGFLDSDHEGDEDGSVY